MGYIGNLSVRAYVDKNKPSEQLLKKFNLAGIEIISAPEGTIHWLMFVDIFFWALKRRTVVEGNLLFTPLTLVVLSQSFKDDSVFSSGVLCRAFNREDYNVVVASFESLVVGGISTDQSETEDQLFIPPPNHIITVIGGPSGVAKDVVINQLRHVLKGLRCVLIDEFISMVAKGEEDILIEVPTKEDLLRLQHVLPPNTSVFIFLVVNSDLSVPVKMGQEELLICEARAEACYLGFDYLVVETKGERDDAVSLLKSIIDSKKSKLQRKA